jgi:xylan 1,4-beta-xylosidase
LTWAFEYDDYPYFDGFRVLSTNEIVKPVLNFHRMIGKMGGNRVEAISSGQVDLETAVSSGIRGSADVGVISSLEGDRPSVLVWHYHDDDVPLPNADVSISIKRVPWSGEGKLTHYRVDENHTNAYSTWLKQGSPQEPSPQQYAALKKAGDLATMDGPSEVQIKRGSAHVCHSSSLSKLCRLVEGEAPEKEYKKCYI